MPGQNYGATPYNQIDRSTRKKFAPGCDRSDGLVHLPLSGPGQGIVKSQFNYALVAFSVALPLGIYCLVSCLLTFKIHFHYSFLTWILVILCLFPAAVVFYFRRKAYTTRDFFQAKWMTLLLFNCIACWVGAVFVGSSNYAVHMKRFYDMTYLNSAISVDPSASSQQYIDTGRFLFNPDSFIDTSRAMGVRMGKNYCAAPVVNTKTPVEKREYDFWAIGKDCCDATQPQDNFHCGAVNDHNAHAGMRLMAIEPRAMYRMAVQEAEATYKIAAKHPIFVEWMQDPSREMQMWYNDGLWMFWAGCSTALVIVGFISISASLCFAAAATRSYPCKGTGFVKSAAYNAWMDEENLDEESNDAKQVLL